MYSLLWVTPTGVISICTCGHSGIDESDIAERTPSSVDYQVLFNKSWKELEKISLTVAKVTKFLDVLAEYHEDMDSFDLMVAGISVNLQGVCMGVERLFSHIANDIDDYMPSGDQWQCKLFHQMTLTLPGKRERVIRSDTLAFLLELKTFKVSVRGGFGDDLDASSVIAMALKLPGCFEALKQDCLAFHHKLQHATSAPITVQPPLYLPCYEPA